MTTIQYLQLVLASLALCAVSCSSPNAKTPDKKAAALVDRATAQLQQQNHDSVLILLDEALRIAPNEAYIYRNKVSVYSSRGEYDKAIEAMEEAVRLEPGVAESTMLLGLLYDRTGQSKKAMEAYQTAEGLYTRRLKTSSTNTLANTTNRAFTLLLMDRKREAGADVQALMQEHPDEPILRQLRNFKKDSVLRSMFGGEKM